MNGLVLTAGGARGAYQAGVLKRIGEIAAFRGRPTPFQIISGASAGAINGAALACGWGDFSEATRQLAGVWTGLNAEDVYRTDARAISSIAALWLKDLSLGGLVGGGKAQSLLDATPLRGLLAKQLRFDRIRFGIERGHLYAVGITATNYSNGKSYTFIQGREGHPLWTRSRRLSYSVQLGVDHVWASCAIPVVFQPILIHSDFGDYFYGDGALRLVTPFSPVIRLGASRVFAIGIRSQKAAEDKLEAGQRDRAEARPVAKRPAMAEIFGVALNSIFLDHLDADLDHLVRMNDLIRHYDRAPTPNRPGATGALEHVPMRVIEPFVVSPSIDLGDLAESFTGRMPKTIRYMMEGLGSSRAESADLMSYLLFDSAFTRTLVEIGYRDAGARADEIEAFLRAREASSVRAGSA